MKILYSLHIVFLVILAAGCSDSSSGNVTLKGAGSVSSGGASVFHAAIDPSQLKVKVYKFAVSTSTDCTNLTTIYESTTGSYVNMLDNPTIGSGNLADGSYPCVAMEVSDNIKFTPASTEGSCTAGTEYTIDVCRTDNSGASTLVDGTSVTCTGTSSTLGDDRVAIYMSTTGTVGADAFVPAAPFPLTAAFTVSGTAVATFIVDGTGQVESGGAECGMQPPTFGFE